MKKEERPGKDKVPYWQLFFPLLVLPVVVGLWPVANLIHRHFKPIWDWPCTLTLSLPIPLRLYNMTYWSNSLFLIFDIWALWHSARMSKLKSSGLDQYAAGLFKQQFGTGGAERVNSQISTLIQEMFMGNSPRPHYG